MANVKMSKVAVLEEFGQPLIFQDVEIPEVENNALLVKVEMAGVCGSDIHTQQGKLGLGNKKPPMVQGHEVIGRIEVIGEGRSTDANGEQIQVGDRIMWEQTACGSCYWCTVELQPLQCESREYYGFFKPEYLRGGFAEYVYITSKTNIVKIPDVLSNEEAIGVACAFRSVTAGFERIRSVGFQDTVVIQGAGPLGLYATVVAKENNAKKVIVIDASEERLALAKSWGADEIINMNEFSDITSRKERVLSLTDSRGADIVIECTGYAPAFAEGLELIKHFGTYLILGITSSLEVSIKPSLILGKKLTIIGSQSATIKHYIKALEFIVRFKEKYDFSKIVTSHFSLNEVNEALNEMKNARCIKPVIDFTNNKGDLK